MNKNNHFLYSKKDSERVNLQRLVCHLVIVFCNCMTCSYLWVNGGFWVQAPYILLCNTFISLDFNSSRSQLCDIITCEIMYINMQSCHWEIMSTWDHVNMGSYMSTCNHVIVTSCLHGIMSTWDHHVNMGSCHCVIMSTWDHINITSYDNIVWLS